MGGWWFNSPHADQIERPGTTKFLKKLRQPTTSMAEVVFGSNVAHSTGADRTRLVEQVNHSLRINCGRSFSKPPSRSRSSLDRVADARRTDHPWPGTVTSVLAPAGDRRRKLPYFNPPT